MKHFVDIERLREDSTELRNNNCSAFNVGDYIVDCTGASVVGGNGGSSTTVQIHEGVETTLYFSGK